MSNIGDIERKTQNRVIKLFQEKLGFRYLGNFEYRQNNSNIEQDILLEGLRNGKITSGTKMSPLHLKFIRNSSKKTTEFVLRK